MATRTKAGSDLVYLCRELKAPSLARAVERLAERARADNWTHEEFLAACLEREVAARQANGGELRIRAARFPARKTLEEFDFDHQRSLRREAIAHLGALDFVEGRENVVFLGPPGTGKTHLAIALGLKAVQQGHRTLFTSAMSLIAALMKAYTENRLEERLKQYGLPKLLIIDEIGDIPIDQHGAHLFFQLISRRYERGAIVLTSNQSFGQWAEVFGNPIIATAILDRLLHHSVVINIKGASYRLREKQKAGLLNKPEPSLAL